MARGCPATFWLAEVPSLSSVALDICLEHQQRYNPKGTRGCGRGRRLRLSGEVAVGMGCLGVQCGRHRAGLQPDFPFLGGLPAW